MGVGDGTFPRCSTLARGCGWSPGSGVQGAGRLGWGVGTRVPAGRGSSRGPWPTSPQSVPPIGLSHCGEILHHRSGTALPPGTFPVCLFPCLASVSVLLPDGDGPLRFPAPFQLAGVGYETGCERGDPWATLCLPLPCFSEPPRPALSRGASISRARPTSCRVTHSCPGVSPLLPQHPAFPKSPQSNMAPREHRSYRPVTAPRTVHSKNIG